MKLSLALAALAASAFTWALPTPKKEQQDDNQAGKDYAAKECASHTINKEQCLDNKALGYKYSLKACQSYSQPNKDNNCLDVALVEFSLAYPIKTPLRIINDYNVPTTLERQLHNHYLWTKASPDLITNKTHLAKEQCYKPEEQYTLNCVTYYKRIYVFAHELCLQNPNVTQHHLTLQECQDVAVAHQNDWTTDFTSTNWVWARSSNDFDTFIARQLRERAAKIALERDAAAYAQTECAAKNATTTRNNEDCVAFETKYFEKSRDLCRQVIEFSILPDHQGPTTLEDCYKGFHGVAEEKWTKGEDFQDDFFWYRVRGVVNPQQLKPRVG